MKTLKPAPEGPLPPHCVVYYHLGLNTVFGSSIEKVQTDLDGEHSYNVVGEKGYLFRKDLFFTFEEAWNDLQQRINKHTAAIKNWNK